MLYELFTLLSYHSSYILKIYCVTRSKESRSPRLVIQNTLLGKLSRLNDNRWFQCFITRANLTTGLHVIILFRCHYRQIRSSRERRPAMAASHFLFYQSRFYSMIVALSVFPMVAEGYRRHPFIVATIRWCTERGGCFFLSCQPFYVSSFCTR